jgi:hypothetical protein
MKKTAILVMATVWLAGGCGSSVALSGDDVTG